MLLFHKTLQVRIFLCIHFMSKRERKRHWVFRKVRPCVLRFHAVNYFILRDIRLWVSKHHSNCVRGEIYFKEIVSNTRLDLNHSFFTHLICEFLIICRFLLICIYTILFLSITSICVIAYIWSICCSLLLNHKVNCWNISNTKLLYYLYNK